MSRQAPARLHRRSFHEDRWIHKEGALLWFVPKAAAVTLTWVSTIGFTKKYVIGIFVARGIPLLNLKQPGEGTPLQRPKTKEMVLP